MTILTKKKDSSHLKFFNQKRNLKLIPMNKLIISISALFLILMGCNRDMTLRTDVKILDTPLTCLNTILDTNEVGLDCGGSCAPCDSLTPTCNSVNNQLIFDGSTFTLSNATFIEVDYRFVTKAFFNNGDSYITINLRSFDPSRTYSMESNDSEPAFVEIYHTIESSFSSKLVTLADGTVYVHDVDGKRVITICGGRYYSWALQRNYVLETMKLTIN
jgi:hypothetical protein